MELNSDALKAAAGALSCQLDMDLEACLPFAQAAVNEYLAALTKQEPSGWRPIERAPKDGSLILLYQSGCWTEDVKPCDAEVGYWNDDCKAWSSAIAGAEDYHGPTHWQPLPDPPKGEEG